MVVTIRLTSCWAVPSRSTREAFLRSWRRWTTLAAVGARGIGALAVGVVLGAAATADVQANRVVPVVSRESDTRSARLEKFFKYYRCGAPYHTLEYLRAADVYGLDYRLLPAISIRESGCGKSESQENNWWGFHPGHQRFSSIAEGIDFIAQRLTQHHAYKGKTLHEKLFTYNPRKAYPEEVKRIMRQIE